MILKSKIPNEAGGAFYLCPFPDVPKNPDLSWFIEHLLDKTN